MKLHAMLAVLAISLTSCGAPIYIADPIEARVIDAQTEQPIEGAVIVANWQLVKGGLDGQRYQGQLEVKEAVTDKAGRFYLEGFSKANPMLDELRNEDPRILVFKAGYEYQLFYSDYPGAGTQTPGVHRKSSVNGQTIRLKKAIPYVYASGHTSFYPGLDSSLGNVMKDCGWKKIPRMLVAMDDAHKALKTSHPRARLELFTIADLEDRERPYCGSVVEFLRGKK